MRRFLVLASLCLAVSFARAEDAAPLSERSAAAFEPRTRVSIRDGFWAINDELTYSGTFVEGLLLNVRMVNATFEDRNEATRPKGFDADANTEAFLTALPRYVDAGVLAFTLNLQGGMPGYEGALNSAFEPNGALRASYLARVEKVIEACDRLGAVVILGCFYQRQDQVLRDEDAVRKAVVETVKWIERRGYTNVLLEIANEHEHEGFDHEVIKNGEGCASLIRLAKETNPKLLVSASGMGNGRLDHHVMSAADFLLLHFNSTPVARIGRVVGGASKISKPVVCNEDDKTGAEGAKALEESTANLCSWGYMNEKKNQHFPFEFHGPEDDPIVYAKLRELAKPEPGKE